MIRRATKKAARQRRPGLQRFAPLHHLAVTARHLPAAVDAAVRTSRLEGHEFQIFRSRLEIVERGGGMDRVAKRRMLGHVVDQRAVEIDGAAIFEGFDVLGSGLGIAHVCSVRPTICPRPGVK